MTLFKKILLVMGILLFFAVLFFGMSMQLLFDRYEKEQVQSTIAEKKRQTDAYLQLYYETVHDTLATNAQWSANREAVLRKDHLFLETEGAGYLVDDQFKYVDFVAVVGHQGFVYTKEIQNNQKLIEAIDRVDLDKHGTHHTLFHHQGIDYLLHVTRVTDNSGNRPVGRYAIGTAIDRSLFGEMHAILDFTDVKPRAIGGLTPDAIEFAYPLVDDYALYFSYPEPEMTDHLNRTYGLLIASMMITLFLMGLTLRHYLRREAKDLDATVTAIDRISDGHYDEQISVRGSEESRRLATSVNRLSGEIRMHLQEVELRSINTVRLLAKSLEYSDPYTQGHSERVAELAIRLAEATGYTETADLELAARLHDIGKIGIDQNILNKPGKLTPEEFEHIAQHPKLGAELLATAGIFERILPLVRYHHEKVDGTGYHSLKNHEIPEGAKILTVCDIYDAVTSDRPYRPAMEKGEALSLLSDLSGTHLDPTLVHAFIRLMN